MNFESLENIFLKNVGLAEKIIHLLRNEKQHKHSCLHYYACKSVAGEVCVN